jgi:hypothetical protein
MSTSISNTTVPVVGVACSLREGDLGTYLYEYEHVLSMNNSLEEKFECPVCGQTVVIQQLSPSKNLSLIQRVLLLGQLLAIPILVIGTLLILPSMSDPQTLSLFLVCGIPIIILLSVVGYQYIKRNRIFSHFMSGHVPPKVKVVKDETQKYEHGNKNYKKWYFADYVPVTREVEKTVTLHCLGEIKRGEYGYSANVQYKQVPLTFRIGGVNAQRIEKISCPICSKIVFIHVGKGEEIQTINAGNTWALNRTRVANHYIEDKSKKT